MKKSSFLRTLVILLIPFFLCISCFELTEAEKAGKSETEIAALKQEKMDTFIKSGPVGQALLIQECLISLGLLSPPSPDDLSDSTNIPVVLLIPTANGN